MLRWKWTDVAACLVLLGAAAGGIASCTDVGGNGAVPEDGGSDAVADGVSPGAETGTLEDGSLDSTAPGDSTAPADLGDSGATTGPVLVDAAGGVDTGTGTTGVQDSGATNTGTHDTGVVDTGAPDTGAAPDTGTSEAGVPEAGVPEAGKADTGTPEAGGPEAGTPEAGGGLEAGTPDSGSGGDGGALTTEGFLSSLAPDCLSCVQTNGCLDPTMQGGACEDATGTATLLAGSLPDGKTCADPSVLGSASPTEKQVCFATLQKVFASQCAVTLQETPCLCGATDAAMCLAGSATPTGAAYDIFSCDFGSTGVVQIQADFTSSAFGAGQANALIKCAGAFGCNSCFGINP